MYKYLIIENDPKALDYLKNSIYDYNSNYNIMGHASSVKESIPLIKMVNPDIIFLDIVLDDGLGFDVLNSVEQSNFEVIFTTGYDNYYKQALDHFALAYLLKPYHKSEIKKALDRYMKIKYYTPQKYIHLKNFFAESNPNVLIQAGEEYHSVLVNDIICCKADGNYSKIICSNKPHILANQGLKYYTHLFRDRGFFRANRSVLINTTHISSIYKKETIILSNNEKITISTRNRNNLTQLIETLK